MRLPEKLREHRSLLGPGTGDIDWSRTMKLISDLGFNGWIGFEFEPSRRSEEAIADCRRKLGV
jgi:sugar phosphate isomerase/epimerase